MSSISCSNFSWLFSAKDDDGNLAEESLGRSFIQILTKAEQQKFYQIKVPQPARQEEIRQVVVKKKSGAVAGIIAGVVRFWIYHGP